MRILVAHQDARTRGRLMRAARSFRSSDVEVTASPEEALERVRSWQPDIVLMSAPMAERYGDQAPSQDTEGPTGAGLGVVATEPTESPGPVRRSPRWDRAHAAQELAGILLVMDDDPAAPRSPLRSRDLRRAAAPVSSSGQLSDPEREILAAVAAGSTTTELAAEHGVAEDVIDGHVSDVVAKLHRLGDAP